MYRINTFDKFCMIQNYNKTDLILMYMTLLYTDIISVHVCVALYKYYNQSEKCHNTYKVEF